MSDYHTTSSPYHAKKQVGGKGSANNLGWRKYEATTEYSFDNTPDEDEEFDRYASTLSYITYLVLPLLIQTAILTFFQFSLGSLSSYEIQWLQYLNEWESLEQKVCYLS